jgi:transposase-like protein
MQTSHPPTTLSPFDEPDWFGDLERTEGRCRGYLEELRWPEGICCPKCDAHSIGSIPSRGRFYCRPCRHQFSLTSGTVFHRSHLPLWKWFLAICVLLDSEAGVPANQLVRLLGGSYKTAWFVEHRIRAALAEAARPPGVPPPVFGDRARVYERSVVGCYHQLGVKYLPAYLAETSWRLQNRSNPNAFRDTLLALLRAEPVPYGELVQDGRSRSLAEAKA